MGFWDALLTIGGDIGGSFIGDPMLGNQLEGVKNALSKPKGGGAAGIGPTSPTFRRAEQLGDLSKNYAFDYALPEGKSLLKSAEGTLGQAGTELTGAESTLQKPLDYYSKLLGGNRADMMSAEAPEIGIINDQAAQQRANIGKFTPQGGGLTSTLSELPFQQSRDITTLLEKARPDAAQNLEKIAEQQRANAAQRGAFGTEQGALSGMVTGEGLQAGGLSLNAISDQINALLGKAGLEIPLQQQTGAGAYQLLKNAMGQGQGQDQSSNVTDVTGADYSTHGSSSVSDTGVAFPSPNPGDYGGGFITDPAMSEGG
jgi:hypothetical protein